MTKEDHTSESLKALEKQSRNTINNYEDTIRAIIGFINIYHLDNAFEPRLDVKAFQGRRLAPWHAPDALQSSPNEDDVTPDIGITIGNTTGILGEVKKNFPKHENGRAERILTQLQRYDRHLRGWPIDGEQVDTHVIVLLTDISTSAIARQYFDAVTDTTKPFQRPFSIVEFGELREAEEFFLLRSVPGYPLELGDGYRLNEGIKIPMNVFISEYSTTKLYDAEPPVEYLAYLIWVHVVMQHASEDKKFENLRSKSRLPVILTLQDILDELEQGFTFSWLHVNHPERQPQVPRLSWVRRACEFIVEIGDAEWLEEDDKQQIKVLFREYVDPREHFIKANAILEEQKTQRPRLPGFDSYNVSSS